MGNRIKQEIQMTRTVGLFLVLFTAGCAVSTSPSRRVDVKRYLVIHTGHASNFQRAKCLTALEVRDADGHAILEQYVHRQLRSVNPSFGECVGSEQFRLRIAATFGRGVCIDCAAPADKHSGFAFVVMTDGNDTEVASAEWQAWGSGSDRLLADLFSLDVVALVERGTVVPLPDAAADEF